MGLHRAVRWRLLGDDLGGSAPHDADHQPDARPGASAGTATTGTVVPGGFVSAVTGAGAVLPGAGAYGGQQSPDIVANLRVDQTWGGAQIMGALHEVNANYYTATSPGAAGHPSDQWGWAAGAGLKLNLPMITQGDWFQAQVNVTQGALRYLFNTPNTNYGDVQGANEGLWRAERLRVRWHCCGWHCHGLPA